MSSDEIELGWTVEIEGVFMAKHTEFPVPFRATYQEASDIQATESEARQFANMRLAESVKAVQAHPQFSGAPIDIDGYRDCIAAMTFNLRNYGRSRQITGSIRVKSYGGGKS